MRVRVGTSVSASVSVRVLSSCLAHAHTRAHTNATTHSRLHSHTQTLSRCDGAKITVTLNRSISLAPTPQPCNLIGSHTAALQSHWLPHRSPAISLAPTLTLTGCDGAIAKLMEYGPEVTLTLTLTLTLALTLTLTQP